MTRPLMIFAAGFGTRMQPLTNDRPKPLIRVANRTLLDRAIDLAAPAKAAPIVVNAHYKAEMITAHLRDHDIKVVVEAPDILDTGGGLRNALPLLGAVDAVATLNSDNVWSDKTALADLWAHWDPHRMDALLSVVPMPNVHGHRGAGDFDLSDSGSLSFRQGDTAPFVYSGLQIIKPETMTLSAETVFSLKDIWKELSFKNRLFGHVYRGHWCDVGHPAAIKIAEEMLTELHD